MRTVSILFTLLLLSLAPATALGHLSIIRQGLDSGGLLESGDRLGSAVAVGNFDGDDYDDLASGAPQEDLGPVSDAGSVIVNYGHAWGLTHVGAHYRVASSIGGNDEDGAQFGLALAAGDFNDDGYDDLAIGAPYDSVGSSTVAGRVYIVHGSATGLEASASRILTQIDGGGGIESGDEFGATLAVGDFNLDGIEDLAIGAPGEDSDAGVVFMFKGSGTGITNTGALWFKQTTIGFGPNEAGSRFGDALAAANIVDSGHHDLAVGAPYHDVGNASGAGVLYVIVGSATGLTAAGALRFDAGSGLAGGAQSFSRFASSLAAGFFYGGTRAGLAIGEPLRTVNGISGAGRVYVVPGSGSPTGLLFGAASAVNLHQGYAGTLNQVNDLFGLALAAGDRDLDGFDDLAVGTPGKNVVDAATGFEKSDAGLVQVFLAEGLPPWSGTRFFPDTLSDPPDHFELMGSALAFGQFDVSDSFSLAIGCPGQDDDDDSFPETPMKSDAGCVFVLAPWRQVLGLGCRNTALYQCNHELIFSQRPFDSLYTGSTAKVMTTLIACERSQELPPNPDITDETSVEGWVATDIGGSSADLFSGEDMSLYDLLKVLMSVSGNDAAYTIGRWLGGEIGQPDWDVTNFVGEMNTRKEAGSLTMPRTHFSNPTGFDDPSGDVGDHYSTAEDMALLARTSMVNPLFRTIVGTPSWIVPKDQIFLTAGFPFFRYVENVPTVYDWQFLQDLQAKFDAASGIVPNGIKTGTTDGAGACRLFSADGAAGRVIGAVYAYPRLTTSGSTITTECAGLIQLGMKFCIPAQHVAVDESPEEGPFIHLAGCPTQQDTCRGAKSSVDRGDTDSLAFEVYRQGGSSSAHLRLAIARHFEAKIAPMQATGMAIEPFESHRGLRISNLGAQPASIQVQQNAPFVVQTYTISPFGNVDFPAQPPAPTTVFVLSIQNLGSTDAELGIEELGYGLDVTLGSGGLATGLLRHGPFMEMTDLFVGTMGLDPNPGNTVGVRIRRPGQQVVGVPMPMPTPDDGSASLGSLTVTPSPFRERVQLHFEIARRAAVGLDVYDLAGRKIWNREAKELEPGTWTLSWDGRSSNGEPVGSGVYFYRISLDGREAASGRMVRVR